MKKSVSFLLCIIMILSCLPKVSWAAEDVPEVSVTLDLGKGRITIGPDYYRIEDQNQNEIEQGEHTGSYILTGTANPNFLPDNGGGCYVEVYKTTGVDITLDNVNITIPEGKNAHALFVTSADATVNLMLKGTNKITGGSLGRYAVDCLGSTLNIRGNGSLTVNSKALQMPEGVSEEVQSNVVFTSKGIAAETITISGYGIAAMKPLHINGGEVSVIGVIDNGGAEETTTNVAIFYYGEESESEPAVIMTGGKLTAEYASKAGSEGLEIQGTAVNGTVDLSNYGDYCWRTERNDQKFNWSSGTEQQYVNGSDYAALQIQSSIPVELDPNGGTVEPDQVQMGRHDTADDLPTPERSGYSFRGWYTQPDGGIKADSDFEFNEELKLYAHWKKKSSSSSGSSSGSSSTEGSVSDGDQPEKPDPSVDETGDPAADCDHGSDCSLNHFNDVNSEAWYHDGIDFCVTNGLMNGTADKTFAPDRSTSRAMLVTILYQMEGRPEAGDSSFADVSDGTWYSDAVFWASSCGIAGGIGNDRFAPDQALTREQLAVILYQYAKYKGYDVSVDGEADLDFADSADVSSWAKTALKWAVQNKLINGVGFDRLSPKGQATRAQMATILYQFCRIFAQNVTK